MRQQTVKRHLFNFVKKWHGDQRRKFGNEMYWKHLERVANKVEKYGFKFWAVGLLHDVIEDTDCTYMDIWNILKHCQFSEKHCIWILEGVRSLTDVYIKKDYPYLNRKSRKRFETDRLGKIKPPYKVIKCSDLIDNTSSILEHDKKFGEVYLKDKKYLLLKFRVINDHELFKECWKIIENYEKLNTQ